jgi:hypothetical protein
LEERDFGTPERYRHGDRIEQRVRMVDGKEIAGETYAHNATECVLDRYLHEGRLGEGDTARVRHAGAMWLRELFLKTHPSEGVSAYENTPPPDGFSDLSSHMSEAQAWNIRCFNETAKYLGAHWRPLYQVCCLDCGWGTMDPLLDALDALAKHRGLT